MTAEQAQLLAEQLLAGLISPQEFAQRAAVPTTVDLGEAQLDLDRERRCGYPEVVFGEGKPVATLERIIQALAERGVDVLVTRVAAEKAEPLAVRFPAGRYNAIARTWRLPNASGSAPRATTGRVIVVSAGTSDMPVAEEARETAEWMGAEVTLIQDVGVAGPHRLPRHLDVLHQADAVVVVAGMEGALPSVVGGHVDCPVIGVPTSVGYGASFGGVAALLSMLNSCAANVTVVNIDAGFKGGYVAGLIAGKAARREDA